MSKDKDEKRDSQRIQEMLEAIEVVYERVGRDPNLDNPDLYDAVNMRITQICEEAGKLSKRIKETEPHIAWGDMKGMRNRIAHDYANASHGIVLNTVNVHLPELKEALLRMRRRV